MARDPGTRSGWYLWLLLLALPAPLIAGWAIGQLSTPSPPAPQATTVPARPVAAPMRRLEHQPAAGASAGASRSAPSEAAAPAPAAPAATAPEFPPVEISRWTTFDDALAESQRNGKPVLIDFTADWCPPCQRMKQQVFGDRTRGEAVQAAVIPVSVVDRVRESGSNPPAVEGLQRRYQVEAFPTLVVFSPATGRIARAQGFGDADATVAWITQAARSVR